MIYVLALGIAPNSSEATRKVIFKITSIGKLTRMRNVQHFGTVNSGSWK